jgi:hypothetical protein
MRNRGSGMGELTVIGSTGGRQGVRCRRSSPGQGRALASASSISSRSTSATRTRVQRMGARPPRFSAGARGAGSARSIRSSRWTWRRMSRAWANG